MFKYFGQKISLRDICGGRRHERTVAPARPGRYAHERTVAPARPGRYAQGTQHAKYAKHASVATQQRK